MHRMGDVAAPCWATPDAPRVRWKRRPSPTGRRRSRSRGSNPRLGRLRLSSGPRLLTASAITWRADTLGRLRWSVDRSRAAAPAGHMAAMVSTRMDACSACAHARAAMSRMHVGRASPTRLTRCVSAQFLGVCAGTCTRRGLHREPGTLTSSWHLDGALACLPSAHARHIIPCHAACSSSGLRAVVGGQNRQGS